MLPGRIVRFTRSPVCELGWLPIRPNPFSRHCKVSESDPSIWVSNVEVDSFIEKFLIFFLCLNLDKMSIQVLTGLVGMIPVYALCEEEITAMGKQPPGT